MRKKAVPPLSDGGKALRLLLDQRAWTHRRVESISFLANGETRRAISWDFTLPEDLAIQVGDDRVAVPIGMLRKGPLKRFDVRDAGGAALSVWGSVDNGRLAVDVLASGLEGVRGDTVPPSLRAVVESVVFSPDGARAAGALVSLRHHARRGPAAVSEDLLIAHDSLAASLAESFVLVVEMPATVVGTRTILKASYEDDRAKRSPQVNLTGRTTVEIEADGWANARSWHLEVQAPEGLRVARLRHETWDPDSLDVTSESSDGDGAGTAHVTASGVSPYDEFSAEVRLVPDRSALLNPVTLGAALGSALLWGSWLARDDISDKLAELGASGAPLGAVVFGLPALFFALLSRNGEHELVSKVLLGVRLASLGCALSLWIAGVVVVWSPERDRLALALALIASVHTVMLAWLAFIRTVGDGD